MSAYSNAFCLLRRTFVQQVIYDAHVSTLNLFSRSQTFTLFRKLISAACVVFLISLYCDSVSPSVHKCCSNHSSVKY